MYYSYEFILPEMLSYIQFNHRELKTNSELHQGSRIYLATMYNKCTTKSLDSGESVRNRHSNSATDKMGMNTRGKHQNHVKYKKRTGENRNKKAKGLLEQLPSHTETSFQGFCRFAVWWTSHKSRALQCCFPVHENQMQCPLTLQLRSRLSKEIQRHFPTELPIKLCGQWAGEMLFTPLLHRRYTDQPEVQQGCSNRGGICWRLALSELECPLPVASVHVDITYSWLLSWATKHQFSREKKKTH